MKRILLSVCLIFATTGTLPLMAQAFRVVPQKLAFEELPSPEFSGGKQKGFKPKNWLEVETEVTVSMSPAPPSKTADKITVKWFIAVKNPDKPGTFLLLSKDIDYVNIPLEEPIFCSVYLSPASIMRLTGSAGSAKAAVELVGFEVHVNGAKVAEDTNKSKPGWWNTASDKIARSEAVPLLSKKETPFHAMWWDRYAEVGTSAQ
ncbi:MAG: hypothetical protein EAZ42_05050 [Verrucomicrobia bacterium]|nr:MAG: hypothetical protein EAZ42_05050 [Verrucomicrobiota bacterium]